MLRSLLNPEYESVTTDQLHGDWDHLVDPSDDLNSVIANDLSAGETIQLKAGTHTVTKSGLNALEILSDNVTLRGLGQDLTVIKLEDNASTDTSSIDDEAILAIGSDGGASPTGVEIRNLTLDGNKANNTTASNELVHGIQPHDADDWVIENVEVRNCTNSGIFNKTDDTGSGGIVRGCHVHDCRRDLIFLSTDDVRITDTVVENCPNQDGFELAGDNQTVTNCIGRNIAQQPFQIYQGSNITVDNCIAIWGANDTVAGFSASGTSSNPVHSCTYSNCLYIGSNDSSAVDKPFSKGDYTGEGVTWESCTSYQQGQAVDVSSAGETFINMTLIEPEGRALSVSGSDVVLPGLTIVDGSANAVRVLSGGNGAVFKDTTIRGCSDALFITSASNVTMDNPTLVGNSGKGINATGANNISVTGGSISDNGDFGVRTDNSKVVTISGTTLVNNTSQAIRFEASDGGTYTNFQVDGVSVEDVGRAVVVSIPSGTIADVQVNSLATENISTEVYAVGDGTRVFRNGTEFKSSAPTASNYSEYLIGNKIIDQSTSPSEVYYVDGASSLDGPV